MQHLADELNGDCPDATASFNLAGDEDAACALLFRGDLGSASCALRQWSGNNV